MSDARAKRLTLGGETQTRGEKSPPWRRRPDGQVETRRGGEVKPSPPWYSSRSFAAEGPKLLEGDPTWTCARCQTGMFRGSQTEGWEELRGMVTNSESVKREARVCVPVPEIGLMAAVSFYLMGDRRRDGERCRDDRVSTGRKRRVRGRR